MVGSLCCARAAKGRLAAPPITGIDPCALAANGILAATPPISLMNSRRCILMYRFPHPRPATFIRINADCNDTDHFLFVATRRNERITAG